ncbi:MAG: hypothetical protein ABI321_16805 [Polyangia bacterium]
MSRLPSVARFLLGCLFACVFAGGLVPSASAQEYQQPYDQNGGYDESAPPGASAVEEGGMQYGYFGPHPEPYEYGQGSCNEQGPHFHPYPPFDRYLFRESNGYFYFIGDISDFGYQGQMWGYQGNHPLPPEYGGGFCYIDWPHRHPFPPPVSMSFNFIGGYYLYAGAWDPSYYTYRDRWHSYFGGYYRNNYYGGRYWTVRPPAIYRPSYGWGAHGVYRGGQTVNAPGGRRVFVSAPYGRAGYVNGPGRPSYVSPPRGNGGRGYNGGGGRPGGNVSPPNGGNNVGGGRGNVSAPSGGYNGGGRGNVSAPSGGYNGGGGRGNVSAPSRPAPAPARLSAPSRPSAPAPGPERRHR